MLGRDVNPQAILVAMVIVCTTVTTVNGTAAPLFRYHTEKQLAAFLDTCRTFYPNMTDLYSVGLSTERRQLLVLSISGTDPKKHVPLRPKVKYVGNMHGNEVVGREVLIQLIYHLLTNYNSNDTLKSFLDETEIHIMVSMNPDGYNRSIEEVGLNGEACYGYVGRYNKNRVDLNRNFPDYFTPNQDKREPETVAVMDWIARNPFILCANLHGGALVANYPYDNYANANVLPNYSATKDDDVFRYLARKFSFSHQNMFLGVPCSSNEQGFPKGITNGAAWYPVGGGMQDFSYIVGNCMELTLEIGCCKFPHDNEIERNWIANKDALINYLMSVHMGVKGTVRDEETKRPIERALVSIENRDHPRFTTEHGEFWRLLLPKTYTLQVTADEYHAMEMEFTVGSSVTILEVWMRPLGEKFTSQMSSVPRRCAPHAAHVLALLALYLCQ